MSVSNEILSLDKFAFFHKIDADSLGELNEKIKVNRYIKSEPIFQPEDIQQNVYFLKSGQIKISSFNDEKEELIKAILKPSDLFGKLSFLPGSEHSDYAIAMEDCTVCFMRSDDFEQLLQKDNSLNAELMKLVGKRIKRLERRLEGLSFYDAKTRLIEMILDLNEDSGNRIGEEYFIDQKLSHRELAALISTSRQTVTKLLNELREKKLIDFNRRKLIIRNYDGLKSETIYEAV